MKTETPCDQSLSEQRKAMTLEKYKEVQSTSSMLAHELRNPLGVMRIALYNLKRKEHDPALDRHIDVIERKIGESERVIEDLVGYTRFSLPQLASVPAVEVLEQAAREAEAAFPDRLQDPGGVRLVREFGKLPEIPADRNQLLRMLDILLKNAFEAMEGRGGEIRLAAGIRDGELVITVRDQGAGIDPDDMSQIFRPFWTKKAKHEGLGLSLARQICELHAGTLTAESQKNQGSLFTVYLPTL